MSAYFALIKRNTRLFLRDRSTVFFSFLSTIILVALYFLFIASAYTNALDIFNGEGGMVSLGNDAKNFLVYIQMVAGVVVLNSVSLSIGIFQPSPRTLKTD